MKDQALKIAIVGLIITNVFTAWQFLNRYVYQQGVSDAYGQVNALVQSGQLVPVNQAQQAAPVLEEETNQE